MNVIGVMCSFDCRRLDYDRRVSHSYNFTIIASDNGTPSHRGTANVRVSVTNVNDEDPVFVQPLEHVLVIRLPSQGQLYFKVKYISRSWTM